MNIRARIAELRRLMKENGIDVYYIPNEDDHLSDEYTADYFKSKSYISGFTGDYGAVVVTETFAGLWTDGRHFTQAEIELKDTGIELMRMRQEGVLTVQQYILNAVPAGGWLGFDGRVVSAREAIYFARMLNAKKAHISMDKDLVDEVWGKDRPAMPEGKLFALPLSSTGESAEDKIRRIRAVLKEKKADVLLLTELEDPAWLLNIRGKDLACTPVAYAFAMITARRVTCYVDPRKMNESVRSALKEAGVVIKPYESFAEDIAGLKNKVIWADLNRLNAALYTSLDSSNSILDQPSPILACRAVKNETEIKSLINAHIKDGIAMVKFIFWLKETIGKEELTEVDVQNRLYALREQGDGYICPSFTTICAYGENAAMMHYTATEDSCAKLKPKGFLLVDSGGTYMDGTTDLTRTIVIGSLTKAARTYYTKVLQGHLQLARANFLYGTNGYNLDILARGPVWDLGIDYQCGTGHGVGHVLSVHEGPHAIRWGLRQTGTAPFEAGMVVSDEPGVYLPYDMGIRIENELLVEAGEKNFYGQFMHFRNITFCPIDTEAIDLSLLNKADIDQLNAYHAMVYQTLAPYLEKKEKAWLRQATKKLS